MKWSNFILQVWVCTQIQVLLSEEISGSLKQLKVSCSRWIWLVHNCISYCYSYLFWLYREGVLHFCQGPVQKFLQLQDSAQQVITLFSLIWFMVIWLNWRYYISRSDLHTYTWRHGSFTIMEFSREFHITYVDEVILFSFHFPKQEVVNNVSSFNVL